MTTYDIVRCPAWKKQKYVPDVSTPLSVSPTNMTFIGRSRDGAVKIVAQMAFIKAGDMAEKTINGKVANIQHLMGMLSSVLQVGYISPNTDLLWRKIWADSLPQKKWCTT